MIARKFLGDTRGANMVEYILLVGVVALLCIGAFNAFGSKVGDKIQKQGDAVKAIGGGN